MTMNTKPTANDIASAIVELGTPRVEQLRAYHRTAVSMLAAGAQREDLAVAMTLDAADLEHTQALDDIGRWGKSPRGLLTVIGPKGCGKTLAAMRLTVERHAAGHSSRWLPLVTWPTHDRDRQRDWLARAEAARLLVLDDVGAGATNGDYLRDIVEGIILERIAGAHPTLLISNAKPSEIEHYLGARLWDRMNTAGGVVDIPLDTPSLRSRATFDLDRFGRWPRWADAVRLLERLGDESAPWSRFDRQVRTLSGRELTEYMREVADDLSLERAHVRACAVTMADRWAAAFEDAGRAFGLDVESATITGISQAIARKLESRRDVAVGARAMGVAPALPPLDGDAARQARERLRPLGFDVRSTRLRGFELLFNKTPLSDEWPSAEQAWLAGLEHVGFAA